MTDNTDTDVELGKLKVLLEKHGKNFISLISSLGYRSQTAAMRNSAECLISAFNELTWNLSSADKDPSLNRFVFFTLNRFKRLLAKFSQNEELKFLEKTTQETALLGDLKRMEANV